MCSDYIDCRRDLLLVFRRKYNLFEHGVYFMLKRVCLVYFMELLVNAHNTSCHLVHTQPNRIRRLLQRMLSHMFLTARRISNNSVAPTPGSHGIEGGLCLGKCAKSLRVGLLQLSPLFCSFTVMGGLTLLGHHAMMARLYAHLFTRLEVTSYADFAGIIPHGSSIRKGEARAAARGAARRYRKDAA